MTIFIILTYYKIYRSTEKFEKCKIGLEYTKISYPNTNLKKEIVKEIFINIFGREEYVKVIKIPYLKAVNKYLTAKSKREQNKILNKEILPIERANPEIIPKTGWVLLGACNYYKTKWKKWVDKWRNRWGITLKNFNYKNITPGEFEKNYFNYTNVVYITKYTLHLRKQPPSFIPLKQGIIGIVKKNSKIKFIGISPVFVKHKWRKNLLYIYVKIYRIFEK